MQKRKSYIDLHIHTLNSDGYYFPKEIIDLAQKNDTNFIAISDHDSINGLSEFKLNLKEGMIGVSGVEFSSFILINNKKIKLHILGYGFDVDNPKILTLLNEMKQKRITSHVNLLNTVKDKLLRLPEDSLSKIDMERYCWFDREFVKCLEKEKYPTDIIDYYKKYFKSNKFSYGSEYGLDVSRVIDAIKSANGYVVLAHPMAYKLDRDDVTEIIRKLTILGIDGIEVYQSDCKAEDSLYLMEVADRYNLLSSVGSDFHRDFNSDGRSIGIGINSNLCIEETSLTNKILELKKCFKGSK